MNKRPGSVTVDIDNAFGVYVVRIYESETSYLEWRSHWGVGAALDLAKLLTSLGVPMRGEEK